MPQPASSSSSCVTTYGRGGSSSTSCTDECASEQPVEYGTGRLFLAPVHLRHRAFNMDWLVRPFYNNLYTDDPGSGEPAYVGQAGRGWAMTILDHVSRVDDNKLLFYSLKGSIEFVRVLQTNEFLPRPHKPGYTMVHDNLADEYQMGEPDGRVLLFHDHTVNPPELRGQLKGYINPGREMWMWVWDQDIMVASSCRWLGTAVVCEQSAPTPRLKLKLVTVGGMQRVEVATLSIWTQGAQNPERFVARALYEYYTSDETDKGLVGDLKRVTIQRCAGNCTSQSPTWQDWLVSYYRYYTSSSSIGVPHGLKYVLEPEGYHRMSDPNLGDMDPLTASDAQLAPYAEFYYEYDGSRRVTRERRHGTGAGSLNFTFAYTARDGGSDGFNEWKLKTVETRPDGTTITVYTNYLAQVILKDFKSGTQRWYEYNEYDSDGRLIRKALPSAVQSYTQGSTSPQNLSVTLRSSEGLIYDNEYYNSQATAPGHLKTVRIKKGSGGSLIPLRAYEYQANDDGARPLLKRYLVTKETEYLSETDPNQTAVTTYQYGLYSNSVQPSWKVTTHPVVAWAENGSDTAADRMENFDKYGYLTELEDELGAKTQYTWNQELGVVTQRIENYLPGQSGPDKNLTTDFTRSTTSGR
jgi:hypothetical protein